MELNKSIPTHWLRKLLGDVCRLKNGFAFKSIEYQKTGIPVIRISDIIDGIVCTNNSVKMRQSYEFDKYKIQTNDILIAMSGATTGKFGIYKSVEKAYQNQRVGKFEIINKRLLDHTFLYYLIYSLQRQVEKDAYGGAQPNISSNKIEQIKIGLPTLHEQQAIVLKIEQLFSELDKGKEQLEIALKQLKVYRQSVLKWAFEGVNKTRIGELFDFIGGGTPSKNELTYWNGNVPWASVKDVKGDYLNSSQDYITNEGLQNSASRIAHVGEVILVTRISPGKAIITNINTSINQDLKIVKPKFKTTTKYIFYVFKFIEREVVKKSSGTTVLGINLPNLREIKIPKFEFEQQTLIVQEIESRLSVADKLEETILQSLKQAEALRQSILKKAFEGKLLSDAELEAANCKVAEAVAV